MHEVLDKLRQLNAAYNYNLLPPGATVVVGVSGGPDSLCLLHALCALQTELGVALHAATLDHGLRGAAAAADAAFVVETARAWGVPVTAGRVDAAALAAAHKLGIEEAARLARYSFLAEVAAAQGALRVAVAHNADDQSETVLMHFLRGSGLAGLRGMRPAAPLGEYHLLPAAPVSPPPDLALVRPLLTTTRAEVEAYCAAHGLAPRFDRSNADTTYFRNRLRAEVIPYLEALNPNLRALLRRTAEVAAADYEVLREVHAQAWRAALREAAAHAVTFDLAAWRALPLSSQRATLRAAAFRLRASLRDVGFVHVDDAARVAMTGETGAQATLPGGLSLRVDYDALVIAGDAHTPDPPPWPLLWTDAPLHVPFPAGAALPGSAWRLTFTVVQGPPDPATLQDPWRAALAAEAFAPGGEIVLRTRRPGDRFAPQGLSGHTQKLSEFMINARIPKLWRNRIPLLTVNDTIAWVVGWRVSHPFAVSDAANTYIVATFTSTD
ncbi:MAG: tRNA lysidine(34) synthetase TilS [Anaerolineae bacterium]|nr:tRNA lysidine(34) synthetase TilS [Anaerolineae bacterium]